MVLLLDELPDAALLRRAFSVPWYNSSMNRSTTRGCHLKTAESNAEHLLDEVLDLPDDARAELVKALIETQVEDFGVGSSEPA